MSAYISDCQNYYEVIAGASNNAYYSPEEACENCMGTSKKYSPNLGWGLGGACSSAPNVSLSSLPKPPVFISDGKRVFATAEKSAAVNNGYTAYDTACDACKKCRREENSDPDSFLWTEVGSCDNVNDIELPLEYDSDGANWFYNFNALATSAPSPLDACHNASSSSQSLGRPAGVCKAAVKENFTFSDKKSTNNLIIAAIILVVIALIGGVFWYMSQHKTQGQTQG
jgi:hypothetical protein